MTFLRRLIPFLLLLWPALAFGQGSTTVTGHVLQPSGVAPTNAKVCFTLQNFKPQVPKTAAGVIVAHTNFCVNASTTDGSFSTTLWGNPAISPAQTLWRVDFIVNGQQQSSALYNINGNPFNLDTAAPTITFPGPSAFLLGAHTFEFTQAVPSTGWTISHGFGDKNVVFNCYDTNNKFLEPDTVIEQDVNTLVLTFVSAQAGSCTVMNGGNVALTNTPANAILSNPNAAQTITGQPLTIQGAFTAAGVTAGNMNNIVSVDGIRYTTFQAAFADPRCTVGCVIDMRGNSNPAALALGTIDVGNLGPALTLLLGPFNYTAAQIVMRSGTKIYGVGRANASVSGTQITSTSTTNPLVVFNTSSADVPAQGVVLEGVGLVGAPSNTAVGMLLDASQSLVALGGVWFSQFRDLSFAGFNSHSIYLKGPSIAGHNGDNQWVTFTNIEVFRPTGAAGNALRIEGSNNFIDFFNCVFDSPFGAIDNTGSALNVFIGGGTGGSSGGSPYIIHFYDCAIENAATHVQIDGGYSIKFDHCHHEQGFNAFHITQNANGTNLATVGVLIDGGSYNGNVGVNGGNGYILKIDSGVAATDITMRDNIYPSSGAGPDNWLINLSTTTGGLHLYDNTFGGGAGGAGAGTTLGYLAPTQVAANVSFTSMGSAPMVNSITGTDKAFILTYTTGTGTPLNGAGITISLADKSLSTPPVCIANRTDTSPQQFFYIYNLPGSTSNIVFSTNGTAPAATTTYGISVICAPKP